MSTEDSMEVEGSDANNSASEADSHTEIGTKVEAWVNKKW